jgi:hypothetical protein
MPLRMLRYNTAIRLAGHKGRPLQFMTYIGTDPLNMPDGIAEPELLDYRYGLVDMHPPQGGIAEMSLSPRGGSGWLAISREPWRAAPGPRLGLCSQQEQGNRLDYFSS